MCCEIVSVRKKSGQLMGRTAQSGARGLKELHLHDETFCKSELLSSALSKVGFVALSEIAGCVGELGASKGQRHTRKLFFQTFQGDNRSTHPVYVKFDFEHCTGRLLSQVAEMQSTGP